MNRPLLLLILAAMLVFVGSGFYLSFHLSSALIRADMERLMHRQADQLEIFCFASEQWQQLRINRREFRLNGMMYDIKQLTERNGQVEVVALCDERETRLLNSLMACFRHPAPDPSGTPASLMQLIFFKALLPIGIIWKNGVQLLEILQTALLPPALHPAELTPFVPPDFL
ncbi:MAG: hypothetical protein RMK52_02390 [Chitinophagales bacterium]|nr:hypothetical protein [Chitinophagales bacterium]MDW8393073.1 hypothetical protein [Chitinophagales bacterium]